MGPERKPPSCKFEVFKSCIEYKNGKNIIRDVLSEHLMCDVVLHLFRPSTSHQNPGTIRILYLNADRSLYGRLDRYLVPQIREEWDVHD